MNLKQIASAVLLFVVLIACSGSTDTEPTDTKPTGTEPSATEPSATEPSATEFVRQWLPEERQ